MRLSIAAVLLSIGCGVGSTPPVNTTNQSLDCAGSELPVYRNSFAPQSGGSGVATASDAAAGKTSSDATAAIPESGSVQDMTAMQVACGATPCAAGQVGVEVAPKTPNGPGGGFGGDTAGPTDGPTPDPGPAPSPVGRLVCVAPPPACAAGFSAQYTEKRGWECTDCTLVVTYGGLYGNYRRCVNAPTIHCGSGEVPTWSLEDEEWQCKPTCDNGLYDQHVIGGSMVCVPC